MQSTGDTGEFGCPDPTNIYCKLTASLKTSLTDDLDTKETLAKSACKFITHTVTAGTETSPTIPAPTNPSGTIVEKWEKYLLGRERLCDEGNKFLFIL